MKSSTITIVSIFLLVFSGCKPSHREKLIIATAANMQFAMEVLIQEFSREQGIECEMVVSSSGKITAQIYEGAPYDIFLSADMKYPHEIFNKGFAISPPEVYAYGRLVMWSMIEDIYPSTDLLSDNSIQHIAIANPAIAPYGKAALQALNQNGLYGRIENKLVYGESIAQTNQFIISGAAEIGFTAKSVVLSPSFREKGRWVEIDPELYTPIAQGAVMVSSSRQKSSSGKFFEFLFSAKGKEILNKFGYAVD